MLSLKVEPASPSGEPAGVTSPGRGLARQRRPGRGVRVVRRRRPPRLHAGRGRLRVVGRGRRRHRPARRRGRRPGRRRGLPPLRAAAGAADARHPGPARERGPRPGRRRRALRALGHGQVDAGLRARPATGPRALGRRRTGLPRRRRARRRAAAPVLAAPAAGVHGALRGAGGHADRDGRDGAVPLARLVVLERAEPGGRPSPSAASRTPRPSRRCSPTPTASTSRRARSRA